MTGVRGMKNKKIHPESGFFCCMGAKVLYNFFASAAGR